jgi:hypothetical protein
MLRDPFTNFAHRIMSASRSDASTTGRRGKTKENRALKTIQCPIAPGFSLGDGNADKEAEKLIPSPNFYVHMMFVRRNELAYSRPFIL